MMKLRVDIPNKEYNIYIEKGILDNTGAIIKEVTNTKRVVVVTDYNVNGLYGERVKNSLETNGFEVKIVEIPPGEKSKSKEQLFRLYDEILDFGLTRTDLIIALGGGVVGDLTGFSASTLLRGIPYIQIPTTLLAQVDSSVGGKVAIDLERGKNLVGAFYQPSMVIIDPECLKTLNDRVLADGMAEVIKYGAIWDVELFENLEKIENMEELIAKSEEIIYNCCKTKAEIVQEDEMDTGKRMILNFGHTFGHAIEKQYNYETYTHGEGVSAGMVLACELGEKLGITTREITNRVENILKLYNLPTRIEIDNIQLLSAMKVDKKGDGDFINLVLLEKIGKVCLKRVDKSKVLK